MGFEIGTTYLGINMTEDRGQRADDRGQMTEVRDQRTEDGGQKTENMEFKSRPALASGL